MKPSGIHIPRRGVAVTCADCGLVHRYAAKVVKGRVYLTTERLSGPTRSNRRQMQVKVRP
jgi:RNase P subunit RPR2